MSAVNTLNANDAPDTAPRVSVDQLHPREQFTAVAELVLPIAVAARQSTRGTSTADVKPFDGFTFMMQMDTHVDYSDSPGARLRST